MTTRTSRAAVRLAALAGIAFSLGLGIRGIRAGDARTSDAPAVRYQLLVAPGGDPMSIRVDVDHAERLEIDAEGDLLIRVGDRSVRHPRPRAYQDAGGIRREIRTRFEFAPNGDVHVAVGDYDRARTLTIAPLF